ncbi:MAG: hypothetical protein ACK553_04220, partial [Planctomycetota bacterium]
SLPNHAQHVPNKIQHDHGNNLPEIRANRHAGQHRAGWDLIASPAQPNRGAGERGAGERGGARGAGRGGPPGDRPVGDRPSGDRPTPGGTSGEGSAGEGGQASSSESGSTSSESGGEGATGGEAAARRPRGGGGGGGGGGRARAVPSGNYRVTLTVDGKEYAQELRVVSDPNLTIQSDLSGTEDAYDVWTGESDSDVSEENEPYEHEASSPSIIDSDG